MVAVVYVAVLEEEVVVIMAMARRIQVGLTVFAIA